MYLHANAKLGLAGRVSLVRAIEEGSSLKAAAAAFGPEASRARACRPAARAFRLAKRRRIALWPTSSQKSATGWGSARRLNPIGAGCGVGWFALALRSEPGPKPANHRRATRARQRSFRRTEFVLRGQPLIQ